jgi:hypothetical protein
MTGRQIFELFSVYLKAFCFRKKSSAPHVEFERRELTLLIRSRSDVYVEKLFFANPLQETSGR